MKKKSGFEVEQLVYSKFPIIEIDENFVLRQPNVTQNDIESMYHLYNDPRVLRFVPDDCIPYGMEGAKDEARHYSNIYAFKKSIYWFIARKSDNIAIGTCGCPMWDRTNQKCELSYNIHSSYHNQGIVTKAIEKAIAYCFNVMGVVRIESQLEQVNIASIRVLEKNGFTKDGILPKYRRYKNNSHVDVLMMSITDDVFYNQK